MQDGTFTFYMIQHRQTHESEWLKPDGPLHPTQNKEWAFSCHDHFGWVFEPWKDQKPVYPKSCDERHKVWEKTGRKGWWTLKYAALAVQRARKASSEGKLDDTRDGKRTCAARFEFRIVKMVVSQQTTCVTAEEFCDVIAA